MDTTRKYPRSMVEAWPERHPYSIERYRDDRFESACAILLAVAIGMGFAAVLVRWWFA